MVFFSVLDYNIRLTDLCFVIPHNSLHWLDFIGQLWGNSWHQLRSLTWLHSAGNTPWAEKLKRASLERLGLWWGQLEVWDLSISKWSLWQDNCGPLHSGSELAAIKNRAGLGLAQCHFLLILLVKKSHKASPASKGWKESWAGTGTLGIGGSHYTSVLSA